MLKWPLEARSKSESILIRPTLKQKSTHNWLVHKILLVSILFYNLIILIRLVMLNWGRGCFEWQQLQALCHQLHYYIAPPSHPNMVTSRYKSQNGTCLHAKLEKIRKIWWWFCLLFNMLFMHLACGTGLTFGLKYFACSPSWSSIQSAAANSLMLVIE